MSKFTPSVANAHGVKPKAMERFADFQRIQGMLAVAAPNGL
jgi:hypothetical protein